MIVVDAIPASEKRVIMIENYAAATHRNLRPGDTVRILGCVKTVYDGTVPTEGDIEGAVRDYFRINGGLPPLGRTSCVETEPETQHPYRVAVRRIVPYAIRNTSLSTRRSGRRN